MARKLEAIALIATEGVADPMDPAKPKQGTLQALIQRAMTRSAGSTTRCRLGHPAGVAEDRIAAAVRQPRGRPRQDAATVLLVAGQLASLG